MLGDGQGRSGNARGRGKGASAGGKGIGRGLVTVTIGTAAATGIGIAPGTAIVKGAAIGAARETATATGETGRERETGNLRSRRRSSQRKSSSGLSEKPWRICSASRRERRSNPKSKSTKPWPRLLGSSNPLLPLCPSVETRKAQIPRKYPRIPRGARRCPKRPGTPGMSYPVWLPRRKRIFHPAQIAIRRPHSQGPTKNRGGPERDHVHALGRRDMTVGLGIPAADGIQMTGGDAIGAHTLHGGTGAASARGGTGLVPARDPAGMTGAIEADLWRAPPPGSAAVLGGAWRGGIAAVRVTG